MKITLLLLSSLSLFACTKDVRVYEPIAQHTLKASADTDTDVVWVQRYDSESTQTHLLRCTTAQGAPKCDEAKTP